ncbi:MAG: 30S ribosomal protein S16 [Balneolaceae bacterium]
MIKLRLQRKGRKKRPFYHIVVADSRSPRDGRIIERLGRYDNVSEKRELTYDEERIIHWLKIGAQPSDTVRSILRKEGILYKMHLMRWGKSDEEIDAALTEWREQRESRTSEEEHSRKAKQKEILKAEEEAYKKKLEEKAAKAAKEMEAKKAKEEAEAAEAAETVAEEEVEESTEEAATETAAEEKEEPAVEAADEPAAEEAEEKTESVAREEEKEEAAEEVKAEAEEVKEEPKAEEAPAAEAEADTKEDAEEEKTEAKTGTVSTEMNATEAIDHIKNTPLDKLQGFVTDDEDRVTVQRAWESKQSE